MMYYVYILECSDSTYYTGITNNLEKRLRTHNSGKASKYTRVRLPVKYVYVEETSSKSEALKRELKIKSFTKKKKIDLINSADFIRHYKV